MSKRIFLGIVSLLFTGLLTGEANADTDTFTYSQSSNNSDYSPNVIGDRNKIIYNIYPDNSNNSSSEEIDRDTKPEESLASSSAESQVDKSFYRVKLPSPYSSEFP